MIKDKRSEGFTLIEMSLVMLILAMAAAGALSIINRSTDAEKIRETQARMQEILERVNNYYKANLELICPSEIRWGHVGGGGWPSSSTAGKAYHTNGEVSWQPHPGYCRKFDEGKFDTDNTTHVFSGSVPVGELGLPSYYMYDAWGKKILYVVDEDLTTDAGFVANESDIRVLDGNGNSVITDGSGGTVGAAVLLISVGRNGFGGYNPVERAFDEHNPHLIVPYTDSRVASHRTMEDDNVSYDSAFDKNFRFLPLREMEGNAGTDPYDQIFDDILMWRTKSDIESAAAP